jgi:hypothetical protein
MMLIPTDALDIVPAIRLVTQEALLNFCMRLSRHHLGHHFEMHHIVAGRRLMTLRAILRSWRGMQKSGNLPAIRLMAFGAFPAE